MKIENCQVYGLEDSVRAAKFPMSTDTDALDTEMTPGIKRLAQSGLGEGHDNWLNGVVVQFDLTCSNKMWVEMERYHFIDFVSSQSTMHKAAHMDFDKCMNEYVDPGIKKICNALKDAYIKDPTPWNYLKLLYNLPSGLELTARMTTNYRQLKTIYRQRKNHRLPEWRVFCFWIKSLPMSELIVGEEDGRDGNG